MAMMCCYLGRHCKVASVFTNAPMKTCRSVQVGIGAASASACYANKGLALIHTHRVLHNDDDDDDDDNTAEQHQCSTTQTSFVATAIKSIQVRWVSASYEMILAEFDQVKRNDAMHAADKLAQRTSRFKRCTVIIPVSVAAQ
jgi:hypothetical protein